MANVTSGDVLKTLFARIPDLAGLLIALVILFTIYQEQENRLNEIEDKYFQLAFSCRANAQ